MLYKPEEVVLDLEASKKRIVDYLDMPEGFQDLEDSTDLLVAITIQLSGIICKLEESIKRETSDG